jgi:hypothetical protein
VSAWKRWIVAESPARFAGIEFGRARREPAEGERQIWCECDALRAFLSGVRDGQTLAPRGAQMLLALRGV